MVRRFALGAIAAKYRCVGAIVYRLAGADADHYFLINDGDAKTAVLETPGYRYRAATDGITSACLALGCGHST